MYSGYRLKIEGRELSNTYISRGSYSFDKEDRVVDSYEDSIGISHEVVAQKKRVIISFALKEHSTKDHNKIVRFIEKKEKVNVEYYDDYEDDYKVGVFKLKADPFSHIQTIGDRIDYNKLNVTLTEY